MANRIDRSGAGYVIPGPERGAAEAISREGMRPSFGDTLENQNKARQYAETPSIGGVPAMFSLDHRVPEPEDISPPPKPLSLEGASDVGSFAETYMPKLQSLFSAGVGSEQASPEVQAMMAQLQGHGLASSGIRSRSGQGGSR